MFSASSPGQGKQETRLKRELLIEDSRQLANITETSHPDPYSHGGGRITFHYRLHKLLNAIPTNGMTRNAFMRSIEVQ
jgi:hypothetical protein